MTPADALDLNRRFIAEQGETITIRRRTGTGADQTKVDVDTTARVMGYTPEKLIGSIVQGDRRVIALVDTLSALLPLSTSDKIVIRGKECDIKAVDDNTRRIGGTLIALEIQASG